jgi:hypothetical protein
MRIRIHTYAYVIQINKPNSGPVLESVCESKEAQEVRKRYFCVHAECAYIHT